MATNYNKDQVFLMLRNGDPDAFDYYYHEYHQAVFANIFNILQDKEASKDVLQEVFLKLWQQRALLSGDDPVKKWLFVVSHNKAIDFLKTKLKESTILLEDAAVLNRLTETDEIDEIFYLQQLNILEEAVNHLPPKKREVFNICRFEGKSVEHASAVLGISVSSVRDYLKQSTRMIKKYIQKNYSSEPVMLAIILYILSK